MAFQKSTIFILFLLITCTTFAQIVGFDDVLKEHPKKQVPFSLKNTPTNKRFLKEEGIVIKQKTENWLFITCTPEWIVEQKQAKRITNFYFEYAPPVFLDDTARAMHNVNPVHAGAAPLSTGYTGKGVIIGLVDSGLDYRHPDFLDQFGNHRVIRYWDHSITNPTTSPQPYNYGQIWYADDIENGTITSNDESVGHGTTVTGICAGNGMANGRNKGMAPEAEIIFVETNFNLPNWTLTVADACDFIFRVADSLNKPAVINLSVGSYLGSHDGEDPAAELIDLLVQEKKGRFVIGAAGNGGGHDKYHAHQTMNGVDTNFIWLENNPSGSLGNNTVFFDLWSDVSEAQFRYSFGANQSIPSYTDVSSTMYRFAQLNVGTPIQDTLYNSSGDRIATVEIFTEYVGSNFHLQGLLKVDSTDYLMRFSTTGAGEYDLWSGEWLNLNKIVDSLPSSSLYPPIVNYVEPDTLQSLVSSWNCSPNVISVANIRCRAGYVDFNGNYYTPSDNTSPGEIAPSSSIGPTRDGVLKPDISAAGDITLGSAPLFMVGDPAYNSLLDEGGYHLRNGGTSMASPVVAGIAALYLERCGESSIQDFKNDLFATAFSDSYTGTIPNVQYGNGKIDAFELLKKKNGNLTVLGDTLICQVPVELTTNINLQSYEWSTGSFTPETIIPQPDTVYLSGVDNQGCKIYSDTFIVAQGSPLPNPTVSIQGDSLMASSAANYQWYLNDQPISGATNQYYTPTSPGYYSVAVQGNDNCKSFSTAIDWLLKLNQEEKGEFTIYPNPAREQINVTSSGQKIEQVILVSTQGKIISKTPFNSSKATISVKQLAKGMYYLRIKTSGGIKEIPFLKQ